MMMKTTKNLVEFINKIGVYNLPKQIIKIKVKVLDARENFGRIDLLITPLAGEGEAWIDSQSIDFIIQSTII